MIKNDLIKIFKKTFEINNKKEIDLLVSNKIDIGDLNNYDSFNYLKLISKIEKKFKIKIDEKNFFNFNKFKTIFIFLKKNK